MNRLVSIHRGRLNRGSTRDRSVSQFGRWRSVRLTCSPLREIQGGGAEMHRFAATFGVGGVDGDLVVAAGVQVADGEDGHLARMVVDGRRAATLAGSRLAVYLHGELLRQAAVKALDAFHVDRVGGLI